MLNADMSLQKLYARLPLFNTPYERSSPQWTELDVIVTADCFLPPPFKVTNVTDSSPGVGVKVAESGTWFLASVSRLMQALGFFDQAVKKDGRVFCDPWQTAAS